MRLKRVVACKSAEPGVLFYFPKELNGFLKVLLHIPDICDVVLARVGKRAVFRSKDQLEEFFGFNEFSRSHVAVCKLKVVLVYLLFCQVFTVYFLKNIIRCDVLLLLKVISRLL